MLVVPLLLLATTSFPASAAARREPMLRPYPSYRRLIVYFICGNANSGPVLAVFGQRSITALWRV
jgi:hypothetical protein